MNNSTKRQKSIHQDNEKFIRTPKKRRFNFHSNHNGSFFNDIGIIHFRDEQYADAERLFVEALRSEKETASTIICQSSRIQYILENVSLATGEGHSSPNQSPKKTQVSTCQRQEYDEGMHVYNNALHMTKSLPFKIRCATILYNIGLTYTSGRNFEKAVFLFEGALTMMSKCEHHPYDKDLVNSAKIHHNLGHCHYRLGKNEESLIHFKQALAHVREFNLGKADLASALNCVAVIRFQNPSEIMEACELFQRSLSIYRKLSGDFAKEIGTLLNNIGRVCFVKSSFGVALTVFEEALDIRRQQLGYSSLDVAATLLNIAQAHHQTGALDKAMKIYQEFVDLAAGYHKGQINHDVAMAYKSMGRICLERNEKDKARTMFNHALQSERATFGNFHIELASTINELGALCYKMNDVHTALNYFREGLTIEKASSSQSNRRNIVITLRNIAQIQSENGEFKEAIKTYEEAKILQIQVHGKCSPEVASTIVSIGLMHYRRKDFLSSLEFYQEALLIRREYYGSREHPEIATLLNLIGLVLYKLRKYEPSKEVFFQSMVIWQKLGQVNREVASVWYNMATVVMELDNEEYAIKFYLESLHMEQMILGENHPDVCATLQQLGRIYQRRGELDDAIKCLGKALDIKRNCRDNTSTTSVTKLLNMIGNINLMMGNVTGMMECFVEATRLNMEQEEWQESYSNSLVVAGYNFYALSKLHPACAEAA